MTLKLDDLRADRIMTHEVVSLRADLWAAEAARLLLSRGYSGAPVIDEAGHPVGVFTLTDVVRRAGEAAGERIRPPDLPAWKEELEREHGIAAADLAALEDLRVRQLMTAGVRSVPDRASFREVLDALLAGPIHRVFVRDATGVLVGVITTLDLLRALRSRL